MILITHLSVRGIFVTSIIFIALSLYLIVLNSKTKDEYSQAVGIVKHIDDKYQDYPKRHKGDFRYLIIDSYQYPFQIYMPNEIKSRKSLDNLKIGDEVKVYYYENSSTYKNRINNFAQFVDMGETPYFIRGDFQKKIGYWMVGFSLLLNLFSYFLWKRKKLKW